MDSLNGTYFDKNYPERRLDLRKQSFLLSWFLKSDASKK